MSEGDFLYTMVKGPFANLWPMLLLPLVVGALSHAAARRLPQTRADWRVAAGLAAAPGALMLVLAGEVIWRVLTHPHYDPSWQHLVKYQVAFAVAAFVLGRAGVRAFARNRTVQQMVALSLPAGPRLERCASRLGIRARELSCDAPECFVAGAFRPTAYLSTGTLDRLSDTELDAALRHERAHIRGGDVLMLSLLGFLRDLAPGGGPALVAYQQSRERAADQAAVRQSGPLSLASALLALARGPRQPLPAIGIAGSAAADWRLRAILDPTGDVPSRSLTATAFLTLTASFAFAFWPTAQSWIIANLCNCHL